MAKSNQQKILKLVQLALLSAIIVVLQLYINIPLPGSLTLSLVLVPIVVGAILLGPASGAFLGGVFGLVVSILVVTGRAGELSTMMFTEAPVLTIAICMLKGIGAGLGAGLIAKACGKRDFLGALLSAAAAPLINSGIFVLGLLLGFQDVLSRFAEMIGYTGTSLIVFTLVVLVGLNFVVEFVANVVLSPAITRIVKTVRKTTR